MSQSSLSAPDPPGFLKRNFMRYGVRLLVSIYLNVRREGFEHLPDPPYVLNFNHPGWTDPFLLLAWWPRRHRLFVFGPKEEDMSVGWRNHLINWSHMGVPFKPSKSNLLDTTRRAQGVIDAGFVLAIASEGRLSDHEGEIVPLREGAAFFALRAQVPIVPTAVIGTRWVRFRKRVTMRVGQTIELRGRKANRAGMDSLTAELTAAMNGLLAGARDEPPPGRTGRWLTDLFAERPWLNEQKADEQSADAKPSADGKLTDGTAKPD